MVKEAFRDWRPTNDTKLLLDGIIGIVEEYWKDDTGVAMTVRQVHYQCVSRHLMMMRASSIHNKKDRKQVVFENMRQNYQIVSRLLSLAREAGMVDWDAIVDRVRPSSMPSEFDGLDDLVKAAIYSYRRPRWQDQKVYVEVASEKDALTNVFAPICDKWHVRLTIDRGYGSTTAVHDMAMRFKEKGQDGYKCILIYLGDHDPSGLNMPKDIQLRFIRYGLDPTGLDDELDADDWNDINEEIDKRTEFLTGKQLKWLMKFEGIDNIKKITPGQKKAVEISAKDELDESPTVRLVRIGLTMDQVRQYNPPPNKLNPDDSREDKYNERYGPESWELDALAPDVLSNLLESAITEHLDVAKYNEWIKQENQDKAKLQRIAKKGGLLKKDVD
jgi:hypothetical protein